MSAADESTSATEEPVDGGADITLDAGGSSTPNPTDEDIARALQGVRNEDWYVTLHRGDDDYMEVMLDQGDIWVECEEGGKFLQARSYVDEDAAKAMLLAFRGGRAEWRDLAAWSEPPRSAGKQPPRMVLAISAVAGILVLTLLLTALITDNGGWIALLFALAFPGVVAIAMAVKQAEIKRAAAWTKATARIVRSEMATETRNGKEVRVPRVEYEFTSGFHRYRGKRASLAELVTGGAAKAMLKRFPVGRSVPAYYDPADPTRSVLERDPPAFLASVWIFVAVLTAIILAGGWWVLLR